MRCWRYVPDALPAVAIADWARSVIGSLDSEGLETAFVKGINLIRHIEGSLRSGNMMPKQSGTNGSLVSALERKRLPAIPSRSSPSFRSRAK